MMSNMAGMENRLGASIRDLKSTVVSNTASIQNLEERVARGEERFDDAVTSLIKRQLAEAGLGDHSVSDISHINSSESSVSRNADTDRQEAAYWKCRRSLRMWPIRGPDLVAAVKHFLEERLLAG